MSSKSGQGASALDDVRTRHVAEAAEPSGDSPKRQGDKLGAVVGGAGAEAAASSLGRAEDSPKRQGDKLGSAGSGSS